MIHGTAFCFRWMWTRFDGSRADASKGCASLSKIAQELRARCSQEQAAR
jgi:hypothetical protein